MKNESGLYTFHSSMEPLLPSDTSGKLEQLAIDLIKKSSFLSASMHPITRQAVANLLRPMNSYYSNLIEGHDTHPIEINQALNNDFSKDIANRNLQLEARAHIKVHEEIYQSIKIE